MSERQCWDFHIKYRWWELINDWVNCSKEIEKIKKSEIVDDYVWRIICKEREELESLRSQLKTAVDGLKNTRNALAGDHHAMALEYAEEALKKLKGEEVSK